MVVSPGSDLADEFEALNKSVITFVEPVSEHDWLHICPGEVWPVAGVIRHVADGYTTGRGWINGFLVGKPVPIDQEEIDKKNVAHAAEFAATSKATALDLLASGGADVSVLVRGLTDEQLAITYPVLGDRELSTAQLVKVLIRHTQRHLDSARSAVGVA